MQRHLTFCFVYEPAPGHSDMTFSLAWLFVAKAKDIPEKVVPYHGGVSSQGRFIALARVVKRCVEATDKVDANNQLSLALASTLNFCRRVCMLEMLRDRGTGRGLSGWGVACLPAEPRRRRPLAHGSHVGRIAHGGTGVEGRRPSSHLGRRGAAVARVRTGSVDGGAGRIIGRVAGRAIARAGVIHREARGRRRGADGRRVARVWDLV